MVFRKEEIKFVECCPGELSPKGRGRVIFSSLHSASSAASGKLTGLRRRASLGALLFILLLPSNNNPQSSVSCLSLSCSLCQGIVSASSELWSSEM